MKTGAKAELLRDQPERGGKGLGGAPADFWRPWETLSDQERYNYRDLAYLMTLKASPSSPQAVALVDDILTRVLVPAKAATAPGGFVKPTSVLKLRTALGAILGDLLAATNQGRWAARTTKRDHDTGKAIKGTAFNSAKDALVAAGLLEHVKGFTRHNALKASRRNISPIFRPTAGMLELADGYGVLPQAVGRHFTFAEDQGKAT